MEGEQTAPAGQSRLSSYRDLMPGTVVFEKFEIIRRVGEGGMGVVYQARDLRLNRHVALKVVSSDFLADRDMVRFQNEARALSRLDHKNSATVFDFDVIDGRTPYLSMEFVEGGTLEDLMQTKGKLALAETVEIFIQVCQGLKHAHSKSVIHRDLKAGNIMLSTDANAALRVVLVDFGVAKIDSGDERHRVTTTGVFVGSPLYISPEQIDGRRADARSDIYSLGCILFHCLAGEPPFCAENTMETLSLHKNQPPPMAVLTEDSGIPVEMIGLIAGALAKNPDERPDSIERVEEVLERIADAIVPEKGESSPPEDHRVAVLTSQTLSEKKARLPFSRRAVRLTAIFALAGASALAALSILLPGGFASLFETMWNGEKSADSDHLSEPPKKRIIDGILFADSKLMNGKNDDLLSENLEMGEQVLARRTKEAAFMDAFVDAHVLTEGRNYSIANVGKAYELYKKCRELQLGSAPVGKEQEVEVLIGISSCAHALKKMGEADEALKEAWKSAACPKDFERIADVYSLLAKESQFKNEQKKAETLFRKAIAAYSRAENDAELAYNQHLLSATMMAQADVKQAEQFNRSARQTYRKAELSNTDRYVEALIFAGHLERHLNRFDKSEAFYNEALAIYKKNKKIVHQDLIADLYHNFAYLKLLEGNIDEADRLVKLAARKIDPHNTGGVANIQKTEVLIKKARDLQQAAKGSSSSK